MFCLSIFSQPLILRGKEIGGGNGGQNGSPQCTLCKSVEFTFDSSQELSSQQLSGIGLTAISNVSLSPSPLGPFSLYYTYVHKGCTMYVYVLTADICFPCEPCSPSTGVATFELTFANQNIIDDLDSPCAVGTVANNHLVTIDFQYVCCGDECDPTSDSGRNLVDDEILNPYSVQLNNGNNNPSKDSLPHLQKETKELVYPNPFSDHLSISNYYNIISYEIYDIQGKVVARSNPNSKINSYISTQNLTPGTFTIRLMDESKKVHVIKIFKL